MLQQLIDYAKFRGLAGESEPGLAFKEVHWALCFVDGTFRNVERLEGVGKRGDRGQLRRVPVRPISGVNQISQALVDGLGKAVLWPREDEKKSQEVIEAQHAYFLDLYEDLGKTIPALAPVVEQLRLPEVLAQVREMLGANGAKETETATIMLDGVLVLDMEEWIPWWRARYASIAKSGDTPMVCLATGEVIQPPLLHPPINGLIGGATTGAKLASFNADSFCSYGLDQGQNAAVDAYHATLYQTAFSDLIRSSRLVAGQSRLLFWYSGAVTTDQDLYTDLFVEDPQVTAAEAEARANRLLSSLRGGTEPTLSDMRFYCIAVEGAQSRVVIRDWSEGSFTELLERLASWARDLSVFGPDGAPVYLQPLYKLLQAIRPRQGREGLGDLSPTLPLRLWQSATRGTPLPRDILKAAVQRERMFQIAPSALADGPDRSPGRRETHAARIALLSAYLHRNHGGIVQMNANNPLEVHLEFQTGTTRTAYHCGRLLAVAGYIQYKAMGARPNHGIVDRFYTALCTTPSRALPRLQQALRPHIAKMLNPYGAEIGISDIVSEIALPIPATFNLEDQAAFSVGYYHEIAAQAARARQKREEAASKEEAELESITA